MNNLNNNNNAFSSVFRSSFTQYSQQNPLDIKQSPNSTKKYAILMSPRIYPQKSAHHVSFNQTGNKTVYINGKDFYQHNNIKHHIWWSQQELAIMRNMFMNDLQQVIASNPNKSPKECILELLERA